MKDLKGTKTEKLGFKSQEGRLCTDCSYLRGDCC